MSELKHTDFMKGLGQLLPDMLPAPYKKYRLGETRWFYQVYYEERAIHYEVSRPNARTGRMLEIGLHFESRNRDLNQQLLEAFFPYILEIRAALGDQVVAETWDRGWTKLYEAYPSEALTADQQAFTAKRLAEFIAVVQPIYAYLHKGS